MDEHVTGLMFHGRTATHTFVDATGAATSVGRSFASKHRSPTTIVTGGVQFRLTLDAANTLRLKVKLGAAKVRRVEPIPTSGAPSREPRLSGLIGREVPITPPAMGSPNFGLRVFQRDMDALGPLDAPHVQDHYSKIGMLPTGNPAFERSKTVSFSLPFANTTEAAVIILEEFALLCPGTGLMAIVIAHDAATNQQIDVTYLGTSAAMSLCLAGVDGCVHTIDAGKPTQRLINEANIVPGTEYEKVIPLLEAFIFSRRNGGFIYSQRADHADPTSDMHAGAVLFDEEYVWFADPHFTCAKRESHFGWLENIAHKRGLTVVNLGTFTMQGEEPTCMIHAVLLLLLMAQYIPNGGAPRYRDHPVAERYWYCLLVYMMFKREQIDDASDTEQ
jgi:hypothetical protein